MAGVKSLALLLLLALAFSASATSIAGGDHHMQLHGLLAGRGECRGTVGECAGEADGDDAEDELGSASAESHRRFLQGRGYISYGALRRNQVPCNRRGASYYNCRPGAQANPYRRGCSRITRCRG